MAHLSHVLPWSQLASSFKYTEGRRKEGNRTSLVPLGNSNQEVNIDHFAKSFERTVKELSDAQKSNYNYDTEQSNPHERVIGTEAERMMQNALKYGRDVSESRVYSCGCCCPLHFHGHPNHDLVHSSKIGSCETFNDPHELGKWLGFFDCRLCCEQIGYGEIVDQTKIMIMYGQMEQLLRLASHPLVRLETLYWFPFDNGGRDGWSELLDSTLGAYLTLNTLYLMPNTWPSFATASSTSDGEKIADYRRTAVYQRAVIECTATRRFDVHTLPHRFFFGIPRDALKLPSYRADPLVGLFTLAAQYEKSFKGKYFPSIDDVAMVRYILRVKGLPVEITTIILDFASYTPQSRLKIPDDPLHPMNEEELKKYLSYCWKLLIRCNMLAEACGKDINWTGEVKKSIKYLFYDYPGYPKVLKYLSLGEERPGNWIDNTTCNY